MDEFDEFWNELFKEHAHYKKKYGMDKIWYEQWGKKRSMAWIRYGMNNGVIMSTTLE
jgi:Lhr-like helicase